MRNSWLQNKGALHVNECCLRNPFKYDSLIPASIQLILGFDGANIQVSEGAAFQYGGSGRCSHHHLYKWWVIVDGQVYLKGFYSGVLLC